MAANPYEKQFKYGPDGRPIEELPSRIPAATPQEIKAVPSLGNPAPATPQQPPQATGLAAAGLANPNQVVSAKPRLQSLDSLAPGTPTFTNDSVPDFKTARGGFVGATTDAEAARSLKARAEQDSAAGSAAASMNRAAETMRQTRMGQTVIQEPSSSPRGVFEQAGDGFGDSQMRQAKYEGLLNDSANTKGITKNQRNAMVHAANGLIAPRIAEMEQEYGLMGKRMDAQNSQAKSLMDFNQSQQMTPYQQAQLGMQQQQLDSTAGIKRQAAVTQGLDNVQTNIYNSPEWKNYITMKGQRDITNNLALEDTPAAAHSLATAVAKSSDPSTGVLSGEVAAIKSGSGNIPQRIGGWVNQNILGGSAFLPSVRNDLAKNVNIRADEFRDMAMERVHNLIPELQQRGIALETVLQGDQLKDYQAWLGKQQQSAQPQAQYRWDGSKLVPVN